MLTLPPPKEPEDWVYQTTSASHEATAATSLKTIEPTILAAYEAYQDAGMDSWALSPLPLARCDAQYLRENYPKLSLVGLGGLRQRLLKNYTCSRCDHAVASCLDHHLPKGRFPEYAVLTANLVPCCTRCNGKKLERLLALDGSPLFLHPYFDLVPAWGQYLFVDTAVSADNELLINFGVKRPRGMETAVFLRLEAQFAALDVSTLYKNLAIEDLQDRRDVLWLHYRAGGADAVAKELQRYGAAALNARHANHWKVAMLRSLAVDQDFCARKFKALGPERP